MNITNFKVTKNNGQISVSFDISEPAVDCSECPFMGDSVGVFYYCDATGQEFNSLVYANFKGERPDGCPFGKSEVEEEEIPQPTVCFWSDELDDFTNKEEE